MRVISVVLKHRASEGVEAVNTDLGYFSTSTYSENFEFSPNQKLVGFHGSHISQGLTSLGFITEWTNCNDVDDSMTLSSDSSEQNEEIVTTVMIVVGSAIVLAVFITLLVHCCTKGRRSKVGIITPDFNKDPSNTVNNSNSINGEQVAQDSEQDFQDPKNPKLLKETERMPIQTTGM